MLCYALISVTVRLEGGGTFVNAEYRFADFWSRSNLPCVCLCALSHLFTACGAQTNRTERWLTASLVWLLISGEWGPILSASQTVGSLCQPVIFCGCSVSAYYTPLSCLSPAMALLSWLPSRTVLKNVHAFVVSLMTISSSLNPNLAFYVFLYFSSFIVYCPVFCALYTSIQCFSNKHSS